mmetsp:Transcript_37670/g.80447  ORF Transcript_37670/g.80447 Transcript_37670/m.80447 type:complete len:330 (+) Transcript_37670:213-1202(+)
MERLRSTLIPGEDPDGSERRVVADQPVVIYMPKKKVVGMTFVVTAANMPLSKYASAINALNAEAHVVVGFFVNVLNPPRGNHRAKAELIPRIFGELKDEFRAKQYDIVGHSIGGKIALLVAALYDEENLIRNIVALDPVDQSPVEFTKEVSLVGAASADGAAPPQNPFSGDSSTDSAGGGKGNLSLQSSIADITLTFTDTGYWISKRHNAREIQKNNPSVKLVMHRNSYHMVYCDDDGLLSWKALMGRGRSDDRNRLVREETLTLIKERATRSSSVAGNASGRASGKMQSTVGKAKKRMTNGISDLKEMGEEAQKKGRAAAALSKVMGR